MSKGKQVIRRVTGRTEQHTSYLQTEILRVAELNEDLIGKANDGYDIDKLVSEERESFKTFLRMKKIPDNDEYLYSKDGSEIGLISERPLRKARDNQFVQTLLSLIKDLHDAIPGARDAGYGLLEIRLFEEAYAVQDCTMSCVHLLRMFVYKTRVHLAVVEPSIFAAHRDTDTLNRSRKKKHEERLAIAEIEFKRLRAKKYSKEECYRIIAKRLGVKPGTVKQWLKGRKDLP